MQDNANSGLPTFKQTPWNKDAAYGPDSHFARL